MTRIAAFFVAFLFATSAQAQQTYAPPDAELWAQMVTALSNIPMSLTAHQQVQQLLQNVQAEAARRATKPVEAPK